MSKRADRIVLTHANIVTPDRMLEDASLVIAGGVIERIELGDAVLSYNGARVVDAQGAWLLPGFVDLHNDAIEKEIEPRPNVFVPVEPAFFSIENRLVSHGVTTIFHSLSFADGEFGIRSPERVTEIIERIYQLKRYGAIRHYVHGRYEVTDEKSYLMLQKLLDDGFVQLLSFMDHTPGQGQFRHYADYEAFLHKVHHVRQDTIQKIVKQKEWMRKNWSFEFVRSLAMQAKRLGVPLASHDDDSEAKIAMMRSLGVEISEFPIHMEAAQAATRVGMHVMVGAPNVMRGGSTSNHLRAIDAIHNGTASMLCSDYLPSAMLHAVFVLYRRYGVELSEAVRMATLNPARAVRLGNRIGSIEIGKEADLILVREIQDTPVVEKVFVRGLEVYAKAGGVLLEEACETTRTI